MSAERETWATRVGLILSMAGNAIGLGNFWRFPRLMAANGGGAFMIPYFVALLLVGLPLNWVEWVTGRYGGKYGHGTLGPMFYLMARETLKPRRAIIFGIIGGMLAFAVTTLLNSYYIHAIGWTTAYTIYSATGAYYGVDTVAFFESHINNIGMVLATWAIPMILLFIAAYRGVAKGIELFNLIMMPLLFIFGVILAARSITLGAPIKPEWSTWAGLWYAWKPDFDYLAKNFWSVTLAATGQIFFTLSLGMGIIQNYASYIKKGEDIALGVMTMTSLNEFAEVVLGGSIAVPLAYAYLGPEVVKAGSLGLAFMALPNIFVAMGSIGRFFGVLWFLLLFFAGWTSAIAMYNYLVAMFEEELGIKRKIGSVIVFILYFLLGLPIALDPSLTYFDELDFWVGSFVLIVLGLFDVIVGVWLFKPSNLWRELHDGALVRVPEVFKWILIAITPIYIVILLVGSMVDYYLRGRFAVADPRIIGARIAVIIMFIIGAIETYYALKKKYAKELAENRKIIIVE
ncbi:MAG: sodium-dependent transporter [Desulfurococcus sp.]|nr:sodium-dependent transporter [Desulfurococcus sp.]